MPAFMNTKIPYSSLTVTDALIVAAVALAASYAVRNFAPASVAKAIQG